jgi:hypothetical protein
LNTGSTARGWPRAALVIAVIVICPHARSLTAAEQSGAANAASPSGWNLALTGGVVVNGLTDPAWSLGLVPGRTFRVVLRDSDKESTAALGVGLFTQVYHDRLPWIAPVSFGIGIRGDGRATFYLGPALRFGRFASLTGGVAIGPVAALPGGVVENQPVTDTNFLSNLGTRMVHSWYLGVTYTFASLH